MGKINYRQLSRKEYEQIGREFWSTCTNANSVKQVIRFIDSFLLPSERVMITRRIQVAKRIQEHKTQTAIQEELHIGQSTVDTVERLLEKMGPEEKALLH